MKTHSHGGRATLDRISTVARTVLLGSVLAFAVVGCGGGNGNGTPPAGGGNGGGNGGGGNGGGNGSAGVPLVYSADQDQFDVFELYLADSSKPGMSVKLNPPMVTGGNLVEYRVSPTGAAVAYTADQDVFDQVELYLVDLDMPGQATRINSPLAADRDVIEFVFSPDGDRIVYRADQDEDNVFELYLVDISAAGTSTKINAPLTTGGQVRADFAFSPDGTKVLYRADQDEAGTPELYLVDVAMPGVATQVNAPLVLGGGVSIRFGFTPDGTQIGYIADQEVDERFELFAVDLTELGTSTKLNGPLVAGGDVCRFSFTPDSSRVVYCADEETAGVLELFAVELANPGVSTKLNPPLVAGGQLSTRYEISPDSSQVAYSASQDTAGVRELYLVDFAAPGAATKLSGSMTTGGDVWFFRFRADGQHLAYVADQETQGVDELYGVDLATPGVITKLSAPASSNGLYDFRYSPDNTQVFYISAQDGDYSDLYRVELAKPGVSKKINPALTDGGEVWDFDVVVVN
jgi:Tol biopolymer transport system component